MMGTTSQSAQGAETQAQQASAGINFGQASLQLEAFHAQSGTYAGASLPASFGVTLVRADTTSYCMQSGEGAALQHLAGPGGQPAAGGC